MRFAYALLAVCLLTSVSAAQSSFNELTSELYKACWPRNWAKDVIEAEIADCERFAEALPIADPLHIRAVDLQISLLIAAFRWEDAIILANSFLQKVPAAIDIRLRRIDLTYGSGDSSRVWSDLEYLRQHNGNDPRFLAKYGMYQLQLGSYEDALTSFDAGLGHDPKNLELLQGRVYAFQQLGRTAEALADLDRMVEIDPQRDTYRQRAELQIANGRPEHAIADIEKALSFGPAAIDDTSLLLAQAQIMLDKPKEALAALDAVLVGVDDNARLEDLRVPLTLRLGVLNRLGDRAAAEEALTRLLSVTDESQLLRLQVFLRNMGWDEITINGEADDPTRAALGACVFLQACRSVIQKI